MKKDQLPQDKGQGTDKPQRVSPFHELDDFDSHVDPSLDLPPPSPVTLVVSAILIALTLLIATFL